MIKRKLISSALLFILILAFLVVPVAADLTITDGEKITSSDGSTSSGITIMGPEISKNGTITIDVSDLHAYLASGNLSDANVQVMSYTAAIWTAALEENTLTLTSTETSTVEYETVYLTFLGTAENPWISYTAGEQTIPLVVKRTDGLGVGTINFVIETNGLSVADGEMITAAGGTTSPVITIANSPIVSGGSITVNISGLNDYIVGGTLTTANVKVTSFPTEGIWEGIVADNTLTLISNGGPAGVGETVTLTFSGPWIPDTAGKKIVSLTANRGDGLGKVTFNFRIETPAPGGLSVKNGEKIIVRTGSTSPVFTITNAPIAENGTIVIDILNLNGNVANGKFTNSNVVVDDTAVNATWTGTVTGDEFYGTYLTLTSTEGPTEVGETVTVTFTGANGSAWLGDTYGTEWSGIYTATRTDTNAACDFTIVMETSLGPGGLMITEGPVINATDGVTTAVITITEAPVSQYDTILINVGDLNGVVPRGIFSTDNVIVDDTAANATWTGMVENDGLTLKSNGGDTAVNETVTVTFTGPWIPDTGGNRTILLTVYRMDNYGAYDYRTYNFNFVIDITPPPGFEVVADFSASPTADIAPLTVTFTDLSKGSPTEWSWDFGDGTTSTEQNPEHIYPQTGAYTVILTVWNNYSMSQVSKTGYINVLNGAIIESDTGINGLIISNCRGPQKVTVDTSVLPAALSPGKSVLEIQPPTGSGFKTITFYAMTGTGFTQDGDTISGYPARVILVSEEMAPPSGFSDTVGKMSSFSYSIDLPSYPCNAILNTKIWEGVIPEYDRKLQIITASNTPPAVSIGTAYTAKITKTGIPPGARAKIYMSVNSGWNTNLSGGPGNVFIWRITDDEKYGQILHTNLLNIDPETNIAYYEADSPLGFSTFGISSLTGSNNPFQVVALIGANIINQGINRQSGTGTSTESTINYEAGSSNPDGFQRGPEQAPEAVVTEKPLALSQPAMSTNVGMFGWLLAIIQDYPVILVGVAGVIAVVVYFGWYKRQL